MNSADDIVLKLNVVTRGGRFVRGRVDIRLDHTRLRSEHRELREVDASREISIAGLRRAPDGHYNATVRLSDPDEEQTKTVMIPASGFATLEFVFDRPGIPDEPDDRPPREGEFGVHGTVHHENGQAAPGVLVRAFDVDLLSETLLGEARSRHEGGFRMTYPARPFLRSEQAGPNRILRALDSCAMNATSPTVLDTVELISTPSDFPRKLELPDER